MENDSPNPLEGTWVEKGQIKTNWESFSLDATTFEHRGTRYLVWAQRDPKIFGNSNLYIAAMSNPWTISGKQVMLSKPSYDEDIKGDPLYDPNRHTRVQKIYWSSDGTPIFGVPVPDGPLPSRFRSVSLPTRFIYHKGDRAVLDDDIGQVVASQFRIVPGLADPAAISLEAADRPGSYLLQRGDEIWLQAFDGSDAAAADATWWLRPGLADSSLVSFESYALPGQYLRQRDGMLALASIVSAADATFVEEW